MGINVSKEHSTDVCIYKVFDASQSFFFPCITKTMKLATSLIYAAGPQRIQRKPCALFSICHEPVICMTLEDERHPGQPWAAGLQGGA